MTARNLRKNPKFHAETAAQARAERQEGHQQASASRGCEKGSAFSRL
jgi:hypothetical protein